LVGANFYRGQFDRNAAQWRGFLLHAMRQIFHDQPKAGEGSAKSWRDGFAIGPVALSVQFLQGRRHTAQFRQAPERARILSNPPNEMMSAPAEEVQWNDAVIQQDSFNDQFDRALQIKDPFRLQIRFDREIKVHIFDVEMDHEGIVVPKRTADVPSILPKAGQ